MSQKIYSFEGKNFYEISISRRSADGKRLRRKAKFDRHGRRVASKQIADKIEYRLRKEVEALSKESHTLTWERWHEECLRRMRLTLLEGTVLCYDGPLKGRLPKSWREKPLREFKKEDVFRLIFEDIPESESATKHLQKSV
ncbi:MAG: hypothetical protein OXB88_07695, partial [Bacteriovoracales bacterium]|nr:hypothetical protein [Bacteriovoracales bacterium]